MPPLADQVRGLSAERAVNLLKFSDKKAATMIRKVVESAIANAENNQDLDRRTLVVAEAFADEGPTMKRFQPRAQGRAFRIRKRTAHITVIVESVSDAPAGGGRNRSRQPKKGAQ